MFLIGKGGDPGLDPGPQPENVLMAGEYRVKLLSVSLTTAGGRSTGKFTLAPAMTRPLCWVRAIPASFVPGPIRSTTADRGQNHLGTQYVTLGPFLHLTLRKSRGFAAIAGSCPHLAQFRHHRGFLDRFIIIIVGPHRAIFWNHTEERRGLFRGKKTKQIHGHGETLPNGRAEHHAEAQQNIPSIPAGPFFLRLSETRLPSRLGGRMQGARVAEQMEGAAQRTLVFCLARGWLR